jgi:hypothetical protein
MRWDWRHILSINIKGEVTLVFNYIIKRYAMKAYGGVEV